MKDNRSRDIFYGVVAIATLIVALVGATLAYFSISSSSEEGAVSAVAATVSIDYEDGQKVVAQAQELIPASWDVVKYVYENRASALIDAQAALPESDDRENLCTDANDREVCSLFRFSVKSDITRSITASLKNEYNGFTYLAYGVRDVTNNEWLTLDNGQQFINLTRCDNSGTEESSCYLTPEGAKEYNDNVNATNSIFGYASNGTDYVTKSISTTTQTYDVVLFLKENDHNQNIDQGKEYQGTLVVDVVDTEGSSGRITGCVGDNC